MSSALSRVTRAKPVAVDRLRTARRCSATCSRYGVADAVGVPRLAGAVVEPVRARGAVPEVEHDRHPALVVVPVDHPGGREHLAADHARSSGAPTGARCRSGCRSGGRRGRAPRAATASAIASIISGIAPVALDARDEDVRGHRDQRRLERGALRRERERDLAVIPDLAVDAFLRPTRAERVAHDARPHDAVGARAVDLHRVAVGRLGARERPRPSRTAPGTRGSRSRCATAACPTGTRPR